MNQLEIIFASASSSTTDEEIVMHWNDAFTEFTDYLEGSNPAYGIY